jgi:rhodanese-related sulfurtransferase
LRSEEKGRIEVGELAARLEGAGGIAVIDVREPDEFEGPLGHIPDARNLPLGELPGRVQELSSLTEKPVVFVCRTDRRSSSAAALLGVAGFRDVRVLRGGMVNWIEAGLPVADRSPHLGSLHESALSVGHLERSKNCSSLTRKSVPSRALAASTALVGCHRFDEGE